MRALFAALLLAGCAQYGTPGAGPLQVADVPVTALEGTWVEIASFPFRPQIGCADTTATYRVEAPDRVALVNRCLKNGREVVQPGTATVVAPGKLKVALRGVPFRGDYWILALQDGGRTLIVGTPSRIAGWVLHRDANMTTAEIEAARAVFAASGYEAARLALTPQTEGTP